MVYTFIKDAIQRYVKEDGSEEIGEKVEDDSRRYLSAAGQDREFQIERPLTIEAEADQAVDDAPCCDGQEPEDQVIDHDHGRDSVGDIGREHHGQTVDADAAPHRKGVVNDSGGGGGHEGSDSVTLQSDVNDHQQ